MERACINCVNGMFPPKSDNLEERVKQPHTGECRAHPPLVHMGPAPDGKSIRFYAPFPSVREDCWCGSFTANGPLNLTH